jgi:sugar lactone lactonase YvrE
VDGIALGPEWLYYGALNGSSLYRIRLKDLLNQNLPPSRLASLVERYSDKPLSDGLSVDTAGGVYITDVEHSAIFRVDPVEGLSTLIQSQEIRWPDALSFGPDNFLYVADSALQEVILKSTEHISAQGPYRIFRFQPGFEGVAGQ